MRRHLIHIGYPKAGSTFLQAWFERHPELRYAPGGLAGFHSVYQLTGAAPSGVAVTSHEGLSVPYDHEDPAADARPIQRRQAEVCELLREVYPGSKILVVTRGFREMILSSYSQHVRTGGTDDLAAMCRVLGASMARQDGHHFDYGYLIGLYAEAFGSDNVIVLPFELLRDDTTRFLRAIEERLGISHHEPGGGRVNPSLSPAELYWYPRIGRAVSATAAPLGARARRRAERWYAARSFHNRLGPVVRLLDRARPGRAVRKDDVPPELLALCAGRAEPLRQNPFYAPYAAEYLLGD